MSLPPIVSVMTDCANLLQRYGYAFWSKELERAREYLEKAYASDVKSAKLEMLYGILKFYGGMGSFNDIVIHPHNYPLLPLDQVTRANAEFRQMQSTLYRLVDSEIGKLVSSSPP